MRNGGGTTVKMSMEIDPEQVTVVAFLRSITTNEVVAAIQVDPRDAEETP